MILMIYVWRMHSGTAEYSTTNCIFSFIDEINSSIYYYSSSDSFLLLLVPTIDVFIILLLLRTVLRYRSSYTIYNKIMLVTGTSEMLFEVLISCINRIFGVYLHKKSSYLSMQKITFSI